MPHRWYNVLADMPGQEMSEERYIEIPEEVQDLNRIYRATPLHRVVFPLLRPWVTRHERL